MAGRASIIGAAETSVGKVRDHNEDAHFLDPEAGIFLVCDGMGGHAAGEVASAIAVKTIRARWSSEAIQRASDRWLEQGTPEARKALMQAIQEGVVAAHAAIVSEADRDRGKTGMGTTLVGALVVGGDVVFAHCGDSRAYLVRDGIAMQLTEDHTLLARLLAAGVDVDVEGEGMRFKSMLTNALGIDHEPKVSTFVVPIADGDRFLLCSDGITEYVKEHEIGEVLTKMPSPARSAQKLIEMALERGGGDNATALVVRVLEAGETPRPAELLRREEQAIHACPLWAKVNPQQRLRALRIALPRDYPVGEKIPALTLGDRVAWILVEGEVLQDGHVRGPGTLIYPEALLAERPLPDKDGLAVAQSEVRALALRADDFRELCEDDPELGEALLDALVSEIAVRRPHRRTGRIVVHARAEPRGATEPGDESSFAEETLPGVGVAPGMVQRAPRARAWSDPEDEGTLPGVAAPPRRPGTHPGVGAPEPAPRESSPRLQARGSTPPASLFVPATEVEGDLDRALTDLADLAAEATAAPRPRARAEPAVDAAPVAADDPAGTSRQLSDPEISIEQLEHAADTRPGGGEDGTNVEVLEETSSQRITLTTSERSEPELAVEPLVASNASPEPRPKRSSDAPE